MHKLDRFCYKVPETRVNAFVYTELRGKSSELNIWTSKKQEVQMSMSKKLLLTLV